MYFKIYSHLLLEKNPWRGSDWMVIFATLFDTGILTGSYILGQILLFLLKAHFLSKHFTSFEIQKVYPYLHIQHIYIYEKFNVFLTVHRDISV